MQSLAALNGSEVDIQALGEMESPSAGTRAVLDAVMALLGLQTDSWDGARVLLADRLLLRRLMSIDKVLVPAQPHRACRGVGCRVWAVALFSMGKGDSPGEGG
jgi:hypothetical protein